MEPSDIDESRPLLAFTAYLETLLKLGEMLLAGKYDSSNFKVPFTFDFLH